MRQFVLATLVMCSALIVPVESRAQEKAQADVLAAIQKQLGDMKGQLENLRAQNHVLRQALHQAQQQAQQGGTVYHIPPDIFNQDTGQAYTRPGTPPPTYIDMLIEHNRQVAQEAWAKQRENQRQSDKRRVQIAHESKAMGALYVPRELRDAVLAGKDPKASRDNLVELRDKDFDKLISQPTVKTYFQEKANRIQGQVVSVNGVAVASQHGASAHASQQVRRIAGRMKRDHQDAIVLFGSGGQVGGLDMATQITKRRRDSGNVEVSGPTRDVLRNANRANVVQAAIAHDVDVETMLRHQAVAQANQRMRRSPQPIYSAGDLDQVNRVLNGKVSRTGVPQVHTITERPSLSIDCKVNLSHMCHW